MRLLLVRHGQTVSNVGHALDTAVPGADLTELGRAQAAAVPAALADESVHALFVSDLVRTQQTAQPLVAALGLEPLVRGGIREISAGDLEMADDEESARAYLDAIFGWGTDPSRRVPGGESGAEVLARFDEVVAEAYTAHPAGTVVMVSHGAVIRAWAGLRADNVDLDHAADHWLPNTGLVALEGGPDVGWTVTCWTDTPLGGAALFDLPGTGPGGEPEDVAQARAASD